MSQVLWLAFCPPEAHATVQFEIESRDRSARILQLRHADVPIQMIEELACSAELCRACLYEDDPEVFEELVDRLASIEKIDQLICLVERLDPAHVSRLFSLGATEVVARDGISPSCDCFSGRRMEREPKREGGGCRGCDERAYIKEQESSADATPIDVHEPEVEIHDLDEPEEVGAAHDPVEKRAPHTYGMPLDAKGTQQMPWGAGAGSHDAVGAPVVVAMSGKGGCGVTTIVSSLASLAASAGLRTALIDLDLMFGDACSILGTEEPGDLGALIEPARRGALAEDEVVRASARVAPGLTVWGPMAIPEESELVGQGVSMLIDILRRESDIIFIDTSTYWSDAVAAAVALCDRCLIVGDGAASSIASTKRVIELVQRIGVARTRMIGVLNRFGLEGCAEEYALRFEVSTSLSSKTRIADGGRDLNDLASFGQIPAALDTQTAFSKSMRAFAASLLQELGCSIDAAMLKAEQRERHPRRHRMRLPWAKKFGDAA